MVSFRRKRQSYSPLVDGQSNTNFLVSIFKVFVEKRIPVALCAWQKDPRKTPGNHQHNHAVINFASFDLLCSKGTVVPFDWHCGNVILQHCQLDASSAWDVHFLVVSSIFLVLQSELQRSNTFDWFFLNYWRWHWRQDPRKLFFLSQSRRTYSTLPAILVWFCVL